MYWKVDGEGDRWWPQGFVVRLLDGWKGQGLEMQDGKMDENSRGLVKRACHDRMYN